MIPTVEQIERNLRVRHAFTEGYPGRCRRCNRGRSNSIHRLTARCSVCWKIVKPAELDGARRCNECAP